LKTYSNYFGEALVVNRITRAALAASFASVLFLSAGVQAAIANDASGSEEVSVEATKETPAEAPAEETKKAEEVSVAPAKEEPVAPAAPVVPVVPDPVVVAPAPPVEPAPAPAAPEPAAPAAPVAPQVETPAAPELPATPEKDVFVDPSPVVIAPSLETETPPVGDPVPSEDATPVVNVSVMITTEKEINAQGWIFFSATSQNVAPGATLGDYTVNLTGAMPRFGVNTANLVAGEDGKASTTLWWECATPGATISVTGPNGLVPIFNEITDTTATEHVLPILGTPGCGTTTPTQEVKTAELPDLVVKEAGENQPGSITLSKPAVGATLVCDPANAIQGTVTCHWALIPETPEVKYVFANENDGKPFEVYLGEYSESVPNPGTAPEYAGGGVEFGGKDSKATLIPFEGPFNQREYAFVEVKGTTHDGSPVTVSGKLQEVLGGVTIKETLDLSQLCGKATWTWYAKADTDSESPKWIINAGFLGGLPACDPQGGDGGDDNENPNPNPNPWNPGHGHGNGNGNGNGHGHNGHGGWHNGEWWNNHTGEPGNNGPVGIPGDLNNVVAQSSSVEELGMGNTFPDVSSWSNDSVSVEDSLAETGANDHILPYVFTGLGVLLIGIVLVAWNGLRSRPRRRK
jgi:hypothetical protein